MIATAAEEEEAVEASAEMVVVFARAVSAATTANKRATLGMFQYM